MTPGREPTPKRGLASVHQIRAARLGGKYSRPTGKVWFFLGLGLLVAFGIYKLISSAELRVQRTRVLEQRARLEATAAEWSAFRDKIERNIVESASRPPEDFVSKERTGWDFRSLPGVYFRAPLSEVRDTASVRKLALDSKKDGFVGCFLREPHERGARGEPDAGAFAEQPRNLVQAYEWGRVLSPEWRAEVENAEGDLRLRVFREQIQKAEVSEMPRLRELMTESRFLLLVLDERPEDTDKERLGAPHFSRVVLRALPEGTELFRVREKGEGSVVSAGAPQNDPEIKGAIERQVNNCSLAQMVYQSLASSGWVLER